jgi:hypothetical protein
LAKSFRSIGGADYQLSVGEQHVDTGANLVHRVVGLGRQEVDGVGLVGLKLAEKLEAERLGRAVVVSPLGQGGGERPIRVASAMCRPIG